MENDYKEQAKEILEIDNNETKEVFNLLVPRSGCRNCGHMISSFENIPISSYLIMRGRCRGCKSKISPFYPIVELLTGLLSVWVVFHFGFNYQGLAAIIFIFFLVTMTGIDIKVQLLPDILTIPLMWIGIIISFWNVFISLEMAVIGSIIGYLLLWSVSVGFKIITKRDGMGLGDAKLLAALCAWVHIQYLPVILLIACFSGIFVALLQKILKGNKMTGVQIPFGPYLALGGFFALLYGEEIFNWYIGTLI